MNDSTNNRFPGVVAYDNQWPVYFLTIATKIKAAMQDAALRIDHIGSTSVPDLIAKPVIDIQVTVRSLGVSPSYIDALTSHDLEYRSDIKADRPPPWENPAPDLWRKEYFTSLPTISPRIHLHIREAGNAESALCAAVSRLSAIKFKSTLFLRFIQTNPREARRPSI